MVSQQQNPSEIQHFSEQQMGSDDDASFYTTKPFSIRKYVLEARQKDIYNNWPFPEKYLKVLLKNGVTNMLPPFESSEAISNSSDKNDVGQNYAEKEDSDFGFNDKHSTQIDGTEDHIEVTSDVCMDAAISEVSKKVIHLSLDYSKHERGDCKGLRSSVGKTPLVSKDSTSKAEPSLNHPHVQIVVGLPSTKAFRKRKHKGKPKKRLLADILAEARPCTLEDIDGRSNRTVDLSIRPCGIVQNSTKAKNFGDEGKESMTSIHQACRHILKGGVQKAKHLRDGNIGSDNLFIKRRRVVKFNLNGSKSKLCNRVIIPPGTVEREWESIRGENFVDEGKKKNRVEYDPDSAGGRNLSAKKTPKMKVRGFKANLQDTCISKLPNGKMSAAGTVETRDAVEQKQMPIRRATRFQEIPRYINNKASG